MIINKKKKKRKKKERKNEKKNLPCSGLYSPGRPQSGNQGKQKERQVLRPCKRIKKAVEYKGDTDVNSNYRAWNGLQKLGR